MVTAMNIQRKINDPASSLYESDFALWCTQQAAALRELADQKVDIEHIAEELDGMASSQKSAVGSHLGQLIKHLIKWRHQPSRRGESWLNTISTQRLHIASILDQSPSLKSYPEQRLDWAWQWARRSAAKEMGLEVRNLPSSCEFTIEQILDDEFLPEAVAGS